MILMHIIYYRRAVGSYIKHKPHATPLNNFIKKWVWN